MARYIDADEFKKKMECYLPDERKLALKVLKSIKTADVVDKERYARLLANAIIVSNALKEYKAADFVKVVRCKECKHRDAETGFCEGRGWPMQLVPDGGFCDKGERREDE